MRWPSCLLPSLWNPFPILGAVGSRASWNRGKNSSGHGGFGPADLYIFQSNSSGAQFFVNKKLEIRNPFSEDRSFQVLDTLEEFTKKIIRQALVGNSGTRAYPDLKGGLLD